MDVEHFTIKFPKTQKTKTSSVGSSIRVGRACSQPGPLCYYTQCRLAWFVHDFFLFILSCSDLVWVCEPFWVFSPGRGLKGYSVLDWINSLGHTLIWEHFNLCSVLVASIHGHIFHYSSRIMWPSMGPFLCKANCVNLGTTNCSSVSACYFRSSWAVRALRV